MLAQRGVGVHEDDALRFELLVDLVVDDLGLVLRGDAGDEALPLRLGDAQALVRVADLLGELLPGARLLLGRAHEVLDVVEVDLAEIGAPRRHRLALEELQPLQTGLEHPLGLVLERRDAAHDGFAQPALGGGPGGVGVVPAEFVLSEARQLGSVDQHIRHRHTLLRATTVSSAPAFLLLRWSTEEGMPLGGPNQVAPTCAPTLVSDAERDAPASDPLILQGSAPAPGGRTLARPRPERIPRRLARWPRTRRTTAERGLLGATLGVAARRGSTAASSPRPGRRSSSQVGIVGTGGLVRLTGSGLGCPTWPRCTAESLVPTPEMGIHGVIEFGNRLLTFVLVVVAITMFLFVVRMRRERRDLFWLALAIGLYVPLQAIIGGITVLTNLNPYVVGLHYFASVVLVALAAVLVARVYADAGPRVRAVPALVRRDRARDERARCSSRSSSASS